MGWMYQFHTILNCTCSSIHGHNILGWLTLVFVICNTSGSGFGLGSVFLIFGVGVGILGAICPPSDIGVGVRPRSLLTLGSGPRVIFRPVPRIRGPGRTLAYTRSIVHASLLPEGICCTRNTSKPLSVCGSSSCVMMWLCPEKLTKLHPASNVINTSTGFGDHSTVNAWPRTTEYYRHFSADRRVKHSQFCH